MNNPCELITRQLESSFHCVHLQLHNTKVKSRSIYQSNRRMILSFVVSPRRLTCVVDYVHDLNCHCTYIWVSFIMFAYMYVMFLLLALVLFLLALLVVIALLLFMLRLLLFCVLLCMSLFLSFVVSSCLYRFRYFALSLRMFNHL